VVIIKYIYYLITINKIKYKKRVEVNAIAEKGKIIPELIHLKNLIFDDWFNNEIATRLDNLAKVVSLSTKAGIPVPCLSSTLDYLNSYRTNRLPQNLVQAMRDCFGSHTYERIDREGSFHTEWMK